MKKILAFVLLAFALIACNSCAQPPQPSPPPAPEPSPPIVVVDAGPAPVLDAAPPPAPATGDACGAAEARAAALNCPLTQTVKAATWATVCRAYQASGVDMHVSCVAGAADCGAIKACLSH